jgi:peptidyl-prolyl cis-trans isomerase-like protein 2
VTGKGSQVLVSKPGSQQRTVSHQTGKPVPYNAARHTTGLAAASFTSTGLTPHTQADLALLTDEQYMLKRGRVKNKGYARLSTTMGDVNLELHTEYAPKAVWNFIHLAKKGYYKDVVFHRNIKGFMIQGGDPTGTGRGGESIWGKNFDDEFDGPYKHDARGTLSMANKGKNTNSSQLYVPPSSSHLQYVRLELTQQQLHCIPRPPSSEQQTHSLRSDNRRSITFIYDAKCDGTCARRPHDQ